MLRRFAPVMALGAFLITALLSGRSEARLEPYYVVNGLSFGQIKPRILFVLDTSGSMTWRAQASVDMCEVTECEAGDGTGNKQSRIHAARLAIHTIVQNIGDGANFGFMTFDQEPPPSSSGSIPTACSNSGNRFRYSYNAYQAFYSAWGVFFDSSTPNDGLLWQLCGKNRPYAYLRYDNVAYNVSLTNGQDPIPTSPILKGANLYNWYNGYRKVQWFPDFRGVRINVHHNNPDDVDFIRNSWGDYGNPQGQNPSATQKAQISGKDFYYWPYVDGFTGYSTFSSEESTSEYYALGHVIEDNSLNQGALYGPFFLESVLGGNFAQEDIGPKSMEEARQKVLDLTQKFPYGGVDASGGTPWEATVGPVTAAPPASNGPFSHPTIASYLKFAKNVAASDACVPTATILVTDGEPNCAQSGNTTCSGLHKRLTALRTELDSLVYVVGFFVQGQSLNNMACAGAGGCNGNGTCNSPCSGTPTKAWDTCYDPLDHNNECAWIANSAEDLAEALGTIVQGILDIEVDSGAGSSIVDVGVGANNQTGSGDIIATSLKGHTQFPDWKGHVVRGTCDIEDPNNPGQLMDYCVDNGVFDFIEPTFGPCPQSRTWDAGECLQQRDPLDRLVYINDLNNNVYPINKPAGGASTAFLAQLNSPDLGLPDAPYTQAEADAIADFIMGVGWYGGWKLPGLANSSPIVVRRIPPRQTDFAPSVGIRDPHCAGRLLAPNSEVSTELQDFAKNVWDPANYVGSPAHHEYQEAAIIGSDLGLVHAFQFDSGNELFAYLPRYNLETAVAQFAEGGDKMGQPLELEDHHYGVAATANQGWVWDPLKNGTGGWRHLLIIGGGKGGQNYSVLDVSHMSPKSPAGPLEVLWTTADPALAPTYKPLLGETWARPALIYHLPNDQLDDLPESYFVLASGYHDPTPTSSNQGRTIARVDALTGLVQDWNTMPAPLANRYETNFGSVVDMAVGTHCISRYWGEAQESYFLDPAGRFYRWDLGRDNNHESDWGGPWGTGTQAQPIATFRACQGTGDTCTISGSGMTEPFTIPVAVVSSNRIDDAEAGVPPDLNDASQQDQFLIAFASGSLYDDSVDGGDADNDFHSSLYIVTDDHRSNKAAGINIPTETGRVAPGSHPNFARIVLSDLQRERTFTPVPGGETYTETDYFSKAARPVKAPLIRVSRARDMTNVTDPNDQTQLDQAVIGGLEVYYIEFTIYEPGPQACDPRFYDEDNDVWYLDEGSTYEIRLRLTADEAGGFDLVNGAGAGAFDDGVFSGGGLALGAVRQVTDGDCADGTCGPKHGTPSVAPCDPNTDPSFDTILGSRAVGYSELRGFNPYERNN